MKSVKQKLFYAAKSNSYTKTIYAISKSVDQKVNQNIRQSISAQLVDQVWLNIWEDTILGELK